MYKKQNFNREIGAICKATGGEPDYKCENQHMEKSARSPLCGFLSQILSLRTQAQPEHSRADPRAVRGVREREGSVTLPEPAATLMSPVSDGLHHRPQDEFPFPSPGDGASSGRPALQRSHLPASRTAAPALRKHCLLLVLSAAWNPALPRVPGTGESWGPPLSFLLD